MARKTSGVRQLKGGVSPRKRIAGAALAAGQGLMSKADGTVGLSDTTSAKVTGGGIALKDAQTGDPIGMVTYGPVECASGMTPGALVYFTDAPGEWSHTPGTNTSILGYAETETIIFVNPVLG